MPRPTRLVLLAPAAVLALTAVTGCGASDDSDARSSSTSAAPSADASATSSPSGAGGSANPAAAALTITVKGDTVTPKNQRLDVALGSGLEVTVTSDRGGELHVHSSPEQTFDFKAGTSSTTFTFETPGVVEMEEHGSDTLVAQLEVR